LKRVWLNFAEEKKEKGAIAEYTILNQEVEMDENFTIQIKLANPLQEDILERFRQELLNFLRGNLKNSNIKLQAKVVQNTEKKMIYTPQEKFNHLAEKHPMLAELSKRLGLDTDF
jgi:DNA polymerase III subunit gamma/tau